MQNHRFRDTRPRDPECTHAVRNDRRRKLFATARDERAFRDSYARNASAGEWMVQGPGGRPEEPGILPIEDQALALSAKRWRAAWRETPRASAMWFQDLP